jgi:cell division control protein 6
MSEMKETRKIILNEEMFDEEYVPTVFQHRDSQIKDLKSCLESIFRGKKPIHTFLFGPSGAGKTLMARCLMKELEERSIMVAYVNCWENQSLHSIMDKINGDFRIIQAERNSTIYKIERLEKYLNHKPFVLTLDDIDRLDPREIDLILYNLCDLKNTVLVCIGYNLGFLKKLDDRVRSRLVPKIIECPAYSKKELRKTMRMANGDARMAIQTIRNAANCAECDHKGMIDINDLKRSCIDARELKINKVLDNLTEHHRMIFEIIRDRKKIISGKLWDAYEDKCRKIKTKPAPQRTFQYYRDELLNMGLICSKRMRIRGNVRLYSVNYEPI